MKNISTELRRRLHSTIQSRAANCDPRLIATISRKKAYFENENYIDEVTSPADFAQPEGFSNYQVPFDNCKIAVRHTRQGAPCEKIYAMRFSVCNVRKENATDELIHKYELVDFGSSYWGFISCVISANIKKLYKNETDLSLWKEEFQATGKMVEYGDIAFNGKTVLTPNGQREFVTEREPWVFWNDANGTGGLYAKHLDSDQYIKLADNDESNGKYIDRVAATRTMNLPDEPDYGLIVFYFRVTNDDYELCYRQLIDGTWREEKAISPLPNFERVDRLDASRTTDNRVVLRITTDKNSTGDVIEIYSDNQASELTFGTPAKTFKTISGNGYISYQDGCAQRVFFWMENPNATAGNPELNPNWSLVTQFSSSLPADPAQTEWSDNIYLRKYPSHYNVTDTKWYMTSEVSIAAADTTNGEAYICLARNNNGVDGGEFAVNIFSFLRYESTKDISALIDTGTWSSQNDNAIEQCNLSLMTTGDEYVRTRSSLYQPGQLIKISVAMGDSEPFALGAAYIDELDYSERQQTISISGRNCIGYQLSESSYGSELEWTGTMNEIEAGMLELAGVTDYECQSTEQATTLFVPNDHRSIKTGIERMLAYGTRIMLEMPDGKIVIGEPAWIKENWLENGIYQFEAGREVFERSTRLNADAAFTKVCVYDSDNQLQDAYADVPHHDSWNIPTNKIFYEEKPDNVATQAEMQTKADELAVKMQNVGITETFDSPFRPYLLVNDVAEIYHASTLRSSVLGLVTSVRHTFGKKGFSTQFTVDSGGAVMDGISYSRGMYGYNRQQRIVDFLRTAQ